MGSSSEVVAHHFTQAGLMEAAVEWWDKAGTRAFRRSAFVEAIAHLEKALELADRLADGPPQHLLRLRVQLAYGRALRGYGAPDSRRHRARPRACRRHRRRRREAF